MSGICGILSFEKVPVSRPLLHAITSFMAFRGPDAQEIWLDGSIGLGHTLLRTTFESEREHQPTSLDGRVWITADARIDGRADLRKKLAVGHRRGLEDATDDQLILHAYHLWGAECMQHLIGDFAFAIWDEPNQHLFCARDHFGIKPFFYAAIGGGLVFSNTLNCIRQHPAVSSSLNDLAIADFLLFGENKDPLTTTFADINRLPPAHTLTWSVASGVQINRYWCLPTDLGVRYRAAGDYVDNFRELLDVAVADRLRTCRVGIEMSGGLDSSSIAASALSILLRQPKAFELQAQTIVYDRLIPDRERYYAGLVAKHLGIPIHYTVADDYKLYERWDQPETRSPEPVHDPQLAMSADAFRGAASLSRVFLAGWDGDALLSESLRPHFRSLSEKRQYFCLLKDLLRYALMQRQLVPLGWRDWASRFFTTRSPEVSGDCYPDWLNPELEARLNLRHRWHAHRAIPYIDHPTRPYAYRIYTFLSQHSCFFERYDAGNTGLPLEYRQPLMDLRLLDCCLSLPLQPWTVKKHILRESMRGHLPEAVRTRAKSPLAGWPFAELLKSTKNHFDHIPKPSSLERYVTWRKIEKQAMLRDQPQFMWNAMRPHSLAIWLANQDLVLKNT